MEVYALKPGKYAVIEGESGQFSNIIILGEDTTFPYLLGAVSGSTSTITATAVDTAIPRSGGIVKSLTVAQYNYPAASIPAFIYCLNEDGSMYKDEGTTTDPTTIRTRINTNSDILNITSLNTSGIGTATVKKAGYYLYRDSTTNDGVGFGYIASGGTIFNNVQYGGFVAYLGETNPFE